MSSHRIASLRRVLDLYLIQEREAKLAMTQANQRVAFMARRLESVELRRVSVPEAGGRDFVGIEARLSSEIFILMREETLRALHAARLEQTRYKLEWMDKLKTVEQVRGVLGLLQVEMDRTAQRHHQQEIDDLYAARKFSRRKSQP